MSDLTDARQVVGVVGRPIEHSLSPLLHEAAFEAMGIPWISIAFDAGLGDGPGVVNAMRSLHLRGLSVTMPLKSEVARSVDRLDPAASMLDSVNCLTRDGDEVSGASTDGQGLLDALVRTHPVDLTGARVVVVGSGGAARSVVAAFGGAGALEVSVVARSSESARAAAALAGSRGRVGDPTDAAVADVIIEATPIGMAGTPEEQGISLVDPALLHDGQIAVDLVYQPFETPWLHAARQAGASTMGGLGMLVHQAALQISTWTGQSAPVDVMWAAAQRALSS